MPAFQTRLTGAKEMERVLSKLPKKLRERELLSAARAGANVVRKAVIERAPESGISLERRSKRARKAGPLKKNVRVTRVKDTASSIELVVHTGGAFWGMFLEFGTTKQAAAPFFGPAFEQSARPALDRMGKTLGRRLEKTARELAGPLSKISKSTRRRL